MEKPVWNLGTAKGKQAMAAWLDFMLDRELDLEFDAWQMNAHTPENIDIMFQYCRENEPMTLLARRLRDRTVTDADLDRLANFVDPAPKKRGPKVKGKSARDWRLVAAAKDNVRIKELWKNHYGKSYKTSEASAEFAEERWDTATRGWIVENARRGKNRNFAEQ